MLKQEWFRELQHIKEVDPDFYPILERQFRHERRLVNGYAEREQISPEDSEHQLREAGLILGQRVYIVDAPVRIGPGLDGLDELTRRAADAARDFAMHPALHIAYPISRYIDTSVMNIWSAPGMNTGYWHIKKDIEQQKRPFTLLRAVATEIPYTLTFTFGYKQVGVKTQRIPLQSKK